MPLTCAVVMADNWVVVKATTWSVVKACTLEALSLTKSLVSIASN